MFVIIHAEHTYSLCLYLYLYVCLSAALAVRWENNPDLVKLSTGKEKVQRTAAGLGYGSTHPSYFRYVTPVVDGTCENSLEERERGRLEKVLN
jgi:hypothetical protein